MNDVTIRGERPGEEAMVRALNDAAFGQPLEGEIVEGIRASDRWIDGGSLVAEDAAGIIAGHLLISEGDLTTEDGALVRRVWMVGPVAVAPVYQRRGVGSALMRAAIRLATERGQPVLLLLGHADFYPRFGFRSARSLGIEPPRPWADASWMALPLPDWDPSLRGVASFPDPFPDSQAVSRR